MPVKLAGLQLLHHFHLLRKLSRLLLLQVPLELDCLLLLRPHRLRVGGEEVLAKAEIVDASGAIDVERGCPKLAQLPYLGAF